jgi:hypothetical protein
LTFQSPDMVRSLPRSVLGDNDTGATGTAATSVLGSGDPVVG